LRRDFAHASITFSAGLSIERRGVRDERRGPWALRKWNGKTQSFDEVATRLQGQSLRHARGLRRQIPYIRRALEALRIPIHLKRRVLRPTSDRHTGRQAAEQEHEVFIALRDQGHDATVTPQVKILNPQKDNLILRSREGDGNAGRASGEGCGCEALRGDSVDKFPAHRALRQGKRGPDS